MRKPYLIVCVFLSSFSSCWLFGRQDNEHIPLTKNIFLSRIGNEENQFIMDNLIKDEGGFRGNVLINRFVYAVGYNKDFIIAKQIDVDPLTLVSVGQTNYHILDVRASTHSYTFDNIAEFNSKRKLLEIPDTLSFFLQSKKFMQKQ